MIKEARHKGSTLIIIICTQTKLVRIVYVLMVGVWENFNCLEKTRRRV